MLLAICNWILDNQPNCHTTILLAQLMTTLVHYTYTVPLPGLVDWSAFLEPVLPADPVNSQLRQWDPWRALHGRHGSEIHPSHLLYHSSMFGPMAGTSGTHS